MSPEFESLNSSLNEELRRILSDLNESSIPPMNSSQDPVTEDVILGLITNEEEFNNPFHVADSIRNRMIRQAEESGRRALDRDLASFDKVSGENTLRRVWASLKGDSRVRGRKREPEESTTDNDSSNKSLRLV